MPGFVLSGHHAAGSGRALRVANDMAEPVHLIRVLRQQLSLAAGRVTHALDRQRFQPVPHPSGAVQLNARRRAPAQSHQISMRIDLLPNVQNYGSVSMERYASELGAALQACAPDELDLRVHHVAGPRWLPLRWQLRYARFIGYPGALRGRQADLYHILDHSHAHLVEHVPAQRCVLTFHDCIPLLAALGRLPIPVSPAERKASPRRLALAARCARVVVDSEATRDDLIELGGLDPARLHVLPLGVSTCFRADSPSGESRDQEASALRRRLGVSQDSLLLLHVGTPGRYKNVPGLLQVLSRVRHHTAFGRRIHLLRAGAELSIEDQQLARTLGVGDRLHYLGRIGGDTDLARLYRSVDLLLFPSLYEGFGWPPLEAMACGTPVVASNGGALAELMRGVEATADPGDADALATLAVELLSNPQRRAESIARGLARAETLRWPRYARALLQIYRELLG